MSPTELGIQFFFVVLLPGFLFGQGFRFTSGLQGRGGDFASFCYAALCGVILISLMGSASTQFQNILENPIPGGVAFALASSIFGAIVGLPVGWLRVKIR